MFMNLLLSDIFLCLGVPQRQPTSDPSKPTQKPKVPSSTPDSPGAAPEEPVPAPNKPTATPEAPTSTPKSPVQAPEGAAPTPAAPVPTPKDSVITPGPDGPATTSGGSGPLVIVPISAFTEDPSPTASPSMTFSRANNGRFQIVTQDAQVEPEPTVSPSTPAYQTPSISPRPSFARRRAVNS